MFPNILRGEQAFIPLIRFMQYSFVSSSFLILLRYSFLISFHLHLIDYVPSICRCHFLQTFKLFLNLVVPFRPSYVFFSLFIISIGHFSMPNSIPLSKLYILIACIRISNSFSYLENSLMSYMYMRWLTFSCELLSLYPAVHFLSMWLSGIITITNS